MIVVLGTRDHPVRRPIAHGSLHQLARKSIATIVGEIQDHRGRLSIIMIGMVMRNRFAQYRIASSETMTRDKLGRHLQGQRIPRSASLRTSTET